MQTRRGKRQSRKSKRVNKQRETIQKQIYTLTKSRTDEYSPHVYPLFGPRTGAAKNKTFIDDFVCTGWAWEFVCYKNHLLSAYT